MQAQRVMGPYGATRAGTGAPRSSVMAYLVECHAMVPTDIMEQHDPSPKTSEAPGHSPAQPDRHIQYHIPKR